MKKRKPQKKAPPKPSRRYYLHQRIKKEYRYCAVSKTIYAPYTITKIDNKYIQELKDKYHYTIQLEILW